MAQDRLPDDEERLPWLEPYTAPKAAPAPVTPPKPPRRGAGLAIGGIAAIAAALTAGYFVGQRGEAPEPATTSVAEAPVTTRPIAVAPAVTEPVAPQAEFPEPAQAEPDKIEPAQAEPAQAEPAPAAAPIPAARTLPSPDREARRERAIRNLTAERARLRAIRVARESAAAAAAAAAAAPQPSRLASQNVRPWPKMPSPGPAGQVVQLGAFRTEGGALAAYRLRLSRYPVMASMPRVVVPVMTKPRGTVLYVLRLGTASRQQSRIMCRNLRASGDHCIVIG
jgi:hypothetical protein